MGPPVVYAITMIVGLGTFIGLFLVKRSLTKEGWSLANALSEPTRLTIPVDGRSSESAGMTIRSGDGTPIAMTLLEASSSRMIATLGGLAILMLYMGFGIFALHLGCLHVPALRPEPLRALRGQQDLHGHPARHPQRVAGQQHGEHGRSVPLRARRHRPSANRHHSNRRPAGCRARPHPLGDGIQPRHGSDPQLRGFC
jgi:hypothetical protein